MDYTLPSGSLGAVKKHAQESKLQGGDMDELKTYSVKLRKMVTIKDPEIVTLKNGRKAVRGVAAEDPSSKVIRFVNTEQAEKIQGMLG